MSLLRGKAKTPEERLGSYNSGSVQDIKEILKIAHGIANPDNSWIKNILLCTICSVALGSAGTGAYIIVNGNNQEKPLQTGALLLTGSLSGLIGILAGARI